MLFNITFLSEIMPNTQSNMKLTLRLEIKKNSTSKTILAQCAKINQQLFIAALNSTTSAKSVQEIITRQD